MTRTFHLARLSKLAWRTRATTEEANTSIPFPQVGGITDTPALANPTKDSSSCNAEFEMANVILSAAFPGNHVVRQRTKHHGFSQSCVKEKEKNIDP